MAEEKYEKLSTIAVRINSLTSILSGYCENHMDCNKEIANLYGFSEILNETANELYDLL